MTTRKRQRVLDLAARLTGTQTGSRQHCWVVGCKTPPGSASGDGLGRFCRRHLEHYRRHGDPLKGSYKASEIAPHKLAMKAWLTSNRDDAFVAAALFAIESEMLHSGVAVEPHRLRGLSTDAKARAVWARMRVKGRTSLEVLSAILAVAVRYGADYQRAKPEHRKVQIGKALNRLGGGKVKRWKVHDDAPSAVQTLRWFPASEGLVLRNLGERAERLAEFLIADRLMAELVNYSANHRDQAILRSLPFSGLEAK